MQMPSSMRVLAMQASNAQLRLRLVERHVSEQAADLTASFLLEQESERLGCTAAGFRAIQQHEWFKPIDWVALLRRTNLDHGKNDTTCP